MIYKHIIYVKLLLLVQRENKNIFKEVGPQRDLHLLNLFILFLHTTNTSEFKSH